jgi:phospholipase A1/A2
MAFRFAAVCWPLLMLLSTAPASGATIEADSALKRCAAIEDALERLACYDTLSNRLPSDVTPQTSGPRETIQPAEPPQPLAAAIQEGAIGPRLTALSRHWELDPAAKQGTFLLRPHKQNYFLPARYSNAPNNQPSSPTQAPPQQVVDLDNVEAKFQLSLKTKVVENMFDGHADLWLSYTQQSSWQVYNSGISRPFRETDYEPEVFMVFPIDREGAGSRARFVNFGLVHQSNGRADPLSRSWNRLYGQVGLERGNLAVMARAWYRIPESYSDDNNPDIEHFLGYGDLLAVYKWNTRNTVSLLVRNNLSWNDNKGGYQLDWSFPLYGRLKGYVQVFTGYGESLIDYNWRQTTFGVGVLLTDWM